MTATKGIAPTTDLTNIKRNAPYVWPCQYEVASSPPTHRTTNAHAPQPLQLHTHVQQVAGCLHVDNGGHDGP